MRLKDKIEDFNKRWGIEVDSQKEFISFRNRLNMVIESELRKLIYNRADIENDFIFRKGILVREKDYFDPISSASPIQEEIHNSSNLKELAANLQLLFWIYKSHKLNFSSFADAVEFALDSSPAINMRLVRHNDEVEIYPSGAPLLDNEVINTDLFWLRKYPEVYKAFHRSLEFYLINDTDLYKDVAINQRYSLELLLRHILKNDKNLANQNDDLGRSLKEKGIHKTLRTQIQFTVTNLENYYDNWAKHPKKGSHKPSKQEIEFVIYQTGTLMRLLLELEET